MYSQCESKSHTWKSALNPIEGSVKTAAMGLLEPRHVQSPGRNECIICLDSVLTSRADLNQIATRTPLSLLLGRWQSSSSSSLAQLVAALSPNRLTARQPTESDLSSLFHQDSDSSDLISGQSGSGPQCLYTQPSPSIITHLPRRLCDEPSPVLMWDNLSTQACLKGVADLFILNTNATFTWF